MGQEILYCAKCARRLTTGDFEKGLGIRVGARVSCTDCLQDLVASLSPQEQREFAKEVTLGKAAAKGDAKRSSSARIPEVKAARPQPESPTSNMGLILAGVGGGGALLLAAALLLSSGPEKRPTEPTRPAPPSSEEPASVRAAREAVERARKSRQSDLEAQIAAWAQALPIARGTSYEKEAAEMHQGLVEMRKSAHAKEALELDAQAAPLLDREEFGAAVELIERARRRHDTPEWAALLESKLRSARARADSLFAPLVQSAAEAKRKGQNDPVQAARDRVARWQRPDLAAELERTLAAAVADPPPASSSERPWKPIFDGKSLEFMTGASREGWELRDGALVMKTPNAVQTRDAFGDGEIRFRFEAQEVEVVYFGVRRAGKDYFKVEWKTNAYRPLEGKLCELIFTCKGSAVTATLNGEPIAVQGSGHPSKGVLSFNGRARTFRVLSIDGRNLP